jgi:hypothetical protein
MLSTGRATEAVQLFVNEALMALVTGVSFGVESGNDPGYSTVADAGLSRSQVAKRLWVNCRTVSKYGEGETESPPPAGDQRNGPVW